MLLSMAAGLAPLEAGQQFSRSHAELAYYRRKNGRAGRAL